MSWFSSVELTEVKSVGDDGVIGTMTRPQPTAGGQCDNGLQLIYPKCWHTVIGISTCGNTHQSRTRRWRATSSIST